MSNKAYFCRQTFVQHFVDKYMLCRQSIFVDKLFNKNVQQQIAGERLVGMVR